MKPYSSIFRHTDYRQVLRLLIKDKKSTEPGFNQQRLATAIGVQKAYLSRVIQGDRDFNSDQMAAVAKYFKLNLDEQNYLLLLLEHIRTGHAWRKRELRQQIAQVQMQNRNPKKSLKAGVINPSLDRTTTEYYLDPLGAVVHQFLALPAYNRNVQRIASDLGLSQVQFARILTLLENGGFIRKAGQGYDILRTHIHLETDSPLTLPLAMATRYLSCQQLARLKKNEKMSFSVTFTADESTRAAVHESFLKFLREIEPKIAAAPSESVYQINFDLFPWSHSQDE